MSNDIYYRHLRNAKGHPIATLSAKILPSTGTVIGGSLCSKHDQFEYKKGRSIADHRREAIERGNFPKQMALFMPQITDRNECIKVLSRLEVIKKNNSEFHIIDPDNQYEMIYADQITIPN